MSHESWAGSEAITAYLQLMHRQRDDVFRLLDNVSESALWQRPGPRDWSIGENLDHLRVIYIRTLPLLKACWIMQRPFVPLLWRRPYDVAIDNVYRRPDFPQNVGWIWPPAYTPSQPVSRAVLERNLRAVHDQTESFYAGKLPHLLGHTLLYDPAIGRLNLIQALRVGIYHDEMHFATIHELIAGLAA
jgi:hypothetical protein